MRLVSPGSLIDRGQPLRFQFDGREYTGFEGDTVASALLGAGVRVVGRSFKYHRPRGVWGFGVEEPNAIVDIAIGDHREPNARATTTRLRDGLVVRSVNASPSTLDDRKAWIDGFARFIPAAFYYKTFMWPNWSVYEPRIRSMAGLGRLSEEWLAQTRHRQVNVHCDTLVVGGGPAGLIAARQAASEGRDVVLVDERFDIGGSLRYRAAAIEGAAPADWLAHTVPQLREADVQVHSSTTAYGIYDGNVVCAVQRSADGRAATLFRIRPRQVVLAAGVIERPLVFGNNDRPGVMSAEAALYYLRCHGVCVGRRIAIVSNNDSTVEVAAAFRETGASVVEIAGARNVIGRNQVEAIEDAAGRRHDVDAVLVSGGFSPTIHLYAQAKGNPAWSDSHVAFIPGRPVEGIKVEGAAAGELPWQVRASWPDEKPHARAWVDYQNDVTSKDILLAARENFRSVEHLKRYTTLGMATDQGKTSNVNGLALMAAVTGRSIPQTGVTTYRPPYTPVPFLALAGLRQGELNTPVRRLPLEPDHRAAGAIFGEYGGWLRPAVYGTGNIQDEARHARHAVGIFDATPLGKIEVIGPEAASFLDFNYYNPISTLKPGRIRYGFMLQETGVVFDDGVVMRVEDDRFIVSCSSSHVAAVHARLEEWRQDRFDKARLFIHNATPRWATLAVTGPRARALVEAVGLGFDASAGGLPHMSFASGRFEGEPARIARVSFSGDLSFEISVPAPRAASLLAALREAGKAFDATLLGLEAMMILRAEKGYVVIGKDTDGSTMPHDLGLAAPRAKRRDDYIGKRSLFTDVAVGDARRQLVGLAVPPGEKLLPTGAHGVEVDSGKARSIGYVTSSYDSSVLGRPVALGLIERGLSRLGETIGVQHLGQRRTACIVPACAFDPSGGRLNA